MLFTKTFIQTRYYTRNADGRFQESEADTVGDTRPLDTQIRTWVMETGYEIVHPGQVGMHTHWYGDTENPYKVKCVLTALTVLYQEVENVRASAE